MSTLIEQKFNFNDVYVQIFGQLNRNSTNQAIQLAKKYGFQVDVQEKQNLLGLSEYVQQQIKQCENTAILVNGNYVGDYIDFERYVNTFQENLSFNNCDIKNEQVIQDLRTQEEKKNQQQQVQKLTQQNFLKYNMSISSTQNRQKQEKKKSISFQKDNFQQIMYYKQQEIKLEQETWYGQKKIMYFEEVWGLINVEQSIFLQPGLDGKDERRGNSKGYFMHNVLLIRNLLDRLQLKTVIICAHSFGYYVSNYFMQVFPNYVASLMQFGTVGTYPSNLVITFSDLTVAKINVDLENLQKNRQQQFELLNSDKLKDMFIKQIYQNGEVTSEYDEYELSLIIKFHTQFRRGFNEIFETIRNPPKKLRFVAHGASDHLIQAEYGVSSVLHFTCGSGYSQIKLTELQKQYFVELCQSIEEIRQKINWDLFDFNNLESNFMFLLEGVGHSVHKQKGKDLFIPFIVFVCLSQTLLQSQQPSL